MHIHIYIYQEFSPEVKEIRAELHEVEELKDDAVRNQRFEEAACLTLTLTIMLRLIITIIIIIAIPLPLILVTIMLHLITNTK